eukprot:TRINITY_DN5975_c0_g4_i1.p1 TRINITY_DN5975_c0_g4~~TRINITY_DN5975_c0_g4_i1.p1  ORF type:complete len:936 (-),score=269.98 TRINITY_DN5975_c0_g4_i1:37-2844(-)
MSEETIQMTSRNLTHWPEKIFQSPNLRFLSLNFNNIQNIPKTVIILTALKTLHLSSNKVNEIPTELCKLSALETLFISKNKLSFLPDQFGELKMLKSIDLFMNLFKELPESIFSLNNLISLNMGSNKIKSLPDKISMLENLTELDLANNYITSLPLSIQHLKKLKRILLLSNDFKTIDKDNPLILSNLVHLDLSYNFIEKIENVEAPYLEKLVLIENKIQQLVGISSLTSLKFLECAENRFFELPKEMFELKQLKSISFSENYIQEIPDEIGQLVEVTEIDLALNNIKALPATLGKLQKLEKLFLFRNSIAVIPPEIMGCKMLKELYLNNNKIQVIPKEICELYFLQRLEISGNYITELPEEMSKLTQLINLCVASNQLKEIPESIYTLDRLQILNFTDNQLKSIHENITRLTTLTNLNLAFNSLTELPEDFHLPILRSLCLSHNSLSSIPTSISKSKTMSIMVLSLNRLKEVPSASLPKTLQSLVLSGNQIKNLNVTVPLNNLVEMEASNNLLENIDESLFTNCPALLELDVSGNINLEKLPHFICKFPEISLIKATFCNLKEIPKEIFLRKSVKYVSLEGNPVMNPFPYRVYTNEFNRKENATSPNDMKNEITLTSLMKEKSKKTSILDKKTEINFKYSLKKITHDCSNVSWGEMKGWRGTQEDTMIIHKNYKGIKGYSLYAIFDGHRGSETSELCAIIFARYFKEFKKKNKNIRTAIRKTFSKIQKVVHQKLNLEAGCTVAVAVVIDNLAYTANLGDARITLGRQNGLALRLTHDHKGSDTKERKRIRDLGGFVSEKGRVMGDVAVSRALGDCQYSPFVSNEPFDSPEQEKNDPFILYQGDFLIIGCDGIWDEMSDLEAVTFVHKYLENGGERKNCAAALRDFAFSLGSRDNISAIVVFYDQLDQDPNKLSNSGSGHNNSNNTVFSTKRYSK